jgi:hypothetical protein
MMNTRFAGLVGGLTLWAASPATTEAQSVKDDDAGIVFRDVAVLTMDADTALLGQAVVVEGNRIAWIGPVDELEAPPGAQVIDGSGRTLLPGLADMHVHMDRTDVPLFLANGITTVREMNGDDWHVALRDSIAAGEVVGPRMFVASTLLAGEPQPWRHVLIPDATAAYPVAHEMKDRGFDYLKIYDGLGRAAYDAFVKASGTLDIPLVGHIPRDVGLDGVLGAGQASIEHVEQITYATVGHDFDTSRIPEIASRIAASEAWVVPTLASQRMLSIAGTPAYNRRLEAPEVRFVDPEIRGWWASLKAPDGAAESGPDDPRRRRAEAFYGFQRDLTAALFDAGVTLLVGTDTPNPLLVTGFSLHLELSALVDAGIPPIDVLRTATRNAARFVGQEGQWGVVRPGAAADLVLVDGDPLADIGVLQQPAGVMIGGQWLDRAALESMLP